MLAGIFIADTCEDSLKKDLRIFCLIVFTSYQLLLPGFAQGLNLFAQTSQGIDLHQKINLAQKLYFEGNFDSAIDLIKQCLQQGFAADNEKVRAYKILAQAYLAKGFEQPAQEVVKKLLEIVPEYTPVLEEDPPQFVELVKKTKNTSAAKTEKPKSANNTNHKKTYWLWVGSAGVVILGATAILVLNGPESHNSDQDKPLPLPPAWPE
jgi:tetratricopeptide (TPR) repeat protein